MKKLILDTDIGPDCDDAAALALALIYARQGLAELLAVMHCTSSPWGVGAIRAICAWYGLTVPVGTLQDRDLLVGQSIYETYNKPLAQKMPAQQRAAEDAVGLYRRILAGSRPASVELVAIGPWRNLANLLGSGPDEHSQLDGRRLVAEKVCRLTAMAGAFAGEDGGFAGSAVDYYQQAEWNVAMDVASVRYLVDNWPGRITFCGFGVGNAVLSGAVMAEGLPENQPVRLAYQYHNQGKNRPSWDLLTVMHVLDQEGFGLAKSPDGQVAVNQEGVTTFQAGSAGRHDYLLLARPPQELASQLDRLLLAGG